MILALPPCASSWMVWPRNFKYDLFKRSSSLPLCIKKKRRGPVNLEALPWKNGNSRVAWRDLKLLIEFVTDIIGFWSHKIREWTAAVCVSVGDGASVSLQPAVLPVMCQHQVLMYRDYSYRYSYPTKTSFFHGASNSVTPLLTPWATMPWDTQSFSHSFLLVSQSHIILESLKKHLGVKERSFSLLCIFYSHHVAADAIHG